MKRRAAALLCALVLVCQMGLWPARAAEEVCFIAVQQRGTARVGCHHALLGTGDICISRPVFLQERCARNWGSIISARPRICRSSPAAERHCCSIWKRERSATERERITIRWPFSAEMRFLWRVAGDAVFRPQLQSAEGPPGPPGADLQ